MTIIIIIVIIVITQKGLFVKTLRMTNKLVDFFLFIYDIISDTPDTCKVARS